MHGPDEPVIHTLTNPDAMKSAVEQLVAAITKQKELAGSATINLLAQLSNEDDIPAAIHAASITLKDGLGYRAAAFGDCLRTLAAPLVMIGNFLVEGA